MIDSGFIEFTILYWQDFSQIATSLTSMLMTTRVELSVRNTVLLGDGNTIDEIGGDNMVGRAKKAQQKNQNQLSSKIW